MSLFITILRLTSSVILSEHVYVHIIRIVAAIERIVQMCNTEG